MLSSTFFLPHASALRNETALQLILLRIADCYERARSRRQLAELDARGLKDIGLSECDRQRELARSFWQ